MQFRHYLGFVILVAVVALVGADHQECTLADLRSTCRDCCLYEHGYQAYRFRNPDRGNQACACVGTKRPVSEPISLPTTEQNIAMDVETSSVPAVEINQGDQVPLMSNDH